MSQRALSPTSRGLVDVWATVVCATALLVAACEPRPGQEDAAANGASAEETRATEVADAGLSTPESVLHDPEQDVYLVSNINGAPLDADGNGFISRISPAGEVLELRWIDGQAEGVTLHAPKGLALSGDRLYVSDLDAVRIFDRRSGSPLGEVPAEGHLLNDLCVGPDGTVWWTETGVRFTEEGPAPTETDAIHRISNDRLETLVRGPELRNPNGCVADEDGLLVVTFGAPQVLRVGNDGEISTVAELPAGGLDGVVRVGDALYVTSWEASAIFRVDLSTGETRTVRAGLDAPADLGLDAERSRLLVPLFQENRIVFVPL